ncbi:MAG: TrkA family potassium uptake protein [Candidatus Glassbacteria bacterium]
MKVMLVGEGKSLYYLSRDIISKGHHVTVVDNEPEECVQLSRELNATVVQGDGSYSATLEDAGAIEMDVLLAMTPHDQNNLVICQIAMLHFGINRSIAMVNDPENEEVFRKLGIPAFSTTGIIAELIEQRLMFDGITNLSPLGGGKINITEVQIRDGYPVIGKALQEISLPENSLVGVVIRDHETIIPRGGTALCNGDRIILITLAETLGRALKAVTGEGR